MEIARGMVVWSADGNRLGKVEAIHGGVFVVGGGPLHRFVARTDRVSEVLDGRLVMSSLEMDKRLAGPG